jgi:hypothetical protein
MAGSYSSVITDSNAHAWIEVYYDYYGWIQYEATTPYYSDMYEELVPTSGSNTSFPDYGPENSDEIPEEIPEIIPSVTKQKNSVSNLVLPIIIILILSAAAAALFIHIRADRAKKRRDSLIRSANDTSLSTEKRLAVASMLDTGILHLLSYNKLIPQNGEHQREFALRVDEKLGQISAHDFTRISESMLAGEFGTDISHRRLIEISGYYDDLIRCTLCGVNPLKRLWLNYIYLK